MADTEKELEKEQTAEETAAEAENAEAGTETGETEKEADAGQEEKAAEPEKKSFFKKKDKKDKKDLQIEELSDKLVRSMAEFENFRKRTEKEKNAMYEIGAKSVIEKILPVIDNFERGLGTLSEEEAQTPFAEGMDKIYKQLLKSASVCRHNFKCRKGSS